MVKKIIALCVIFSVIFLYAGAVSVKHNEDIKESIEQKLIRLHVVANSDSPEDQDLKRRVKDQIIKEMSTKLKDSKSLDQTRKIIKENIPNIEKIAQEEIKRSGKNYPVKAVLGTFSFPTKNYGPITLPAGSYEALKVVIGEGKGANWWCVLFPPLCFIDVTHAVPADAEKELSKVLTKEEIEYIKGKPRFKSLEIMESILNKIRSLKLAIAPRDGS